MTAKLLIQDGTPPWLSASIVPSKDIVVSPSSSPSLTTVNVSSTNVFVYVMVKNTGTVDFGVCSCAIGPWAAPVYFQNFLGNLATSKSQTQGGVTFTATPLGDSLSGSGISFNLGLAGSGRRAWAWSPDGRCFAYAASPNGADWSLTIVALQDVSRSDGTIVPKNHVAVNASGVWAGTNAANWWNNANFGWAGSKAVLASGAYAAGSGWAVALACPEAASPNVWGDLIPVFPGQVDWAILSSPCGASVAFAPKLLNPTAPPQAFFQILTASAKPTSFKKSNVATSVGSTGANVSIMTTAHTANGVSISTGSGTIVMVDDPDCTLVGSGITARVDRVKASTLPTANLGVQPIGSAALGQLLVGKTVWVQVPNTNGWANQSEKHWCLLAQAYTTDMTTVVPPWNGQATNPPAFPVALDNCAQRNIEINP